MLVRLSGDKWVNSEKICEMHKETRASWCSSATVNGKYMDAHEVTSTVYVLWFESEKLVLSETQGEELLAALPTPFDARRNRAQRTLIGQLGITRWNAMDEDAQYDAVSAEVERA